MTVLSLPPGFIISCLEMREIWKMAFVGSLAGQEFYTSLWFCFGVLRIKEGKKTFFLRNCRCYVKDFRLKLLEAIQFPLWRNFSFPFLI